MSAQTNTESGPGSCFCSQDRGSGRQTSSDVRCAEQFSSLCFVSVRLKENEKEGETGFSIKVEDLS